MLFTKPWADALIVLLVILLFFGPKRLPALGKSLGEGLREFKDSITGHSKNDEEERPALNEAVTPAPTATTPGTSATTPGASAAASAPESAKVASSEPSS